MKNGIAIILLIFTQMAAAQLYDKGGITNEEDRVYNIANVDVQPTYLGGVEEFIKFISNNFNPPAELTQRGRVIVSFIIERDGALSDIKVIRDLGFNTAEETIRVLGLSPKWCPAEKNGKPVRSIYSFPIAVSPRN
jgi:protein TonB